MGESERGWKAPSSALVSQETTLATVTAPGGFTCQSVTVRTQQNEQMLFKKEFAGNASKMQFKMTG